MNKPTGKLKFAYETIAVLEKRVEQLEKDLQIEKIFNNSSHKLIADRDEAISEMVEYVHSISTLPESYPVKAIISRAKHEVSKHTPPLKESENERM